MHTHQQGLSVTVLGKKNMPEKQWRRSRHCFIFIFNEADGNHVIGERTYPVTGQSIHFVAQGLIQSFSGMNKAEGYCIEFSPDFFSRFTLNKEMLYDLPFFGYDIENPCYKIPDHSFDFVYTLFGFMHHEKQGAVQGHERVIISAMNIVLLKCAQWFTLGNKKKNETHYMAGYYGSLQLVENYRRLIREHCKRQHFVKFYAAKLGLTPNYLNTVVKNITGSRASDLIHAQLISEAKYLLVHTRHSHKEVAAELGFTDQSYFTKFFRRETGQNPLEWFRKNK